MCDSVLGELSENCALTIRLGPPVYIVAWEYPKSVAAGLGPRGANVYVDFQKFGKIEDFVLGELSANCALAIRLGPPVFMVAWEYPKSAAAGLGPRGANLYVDFSTFAAKRIAYLYIPDTLAVFNIPSSVKK